MTEGAGTGADTVRQGTVLTCSHGECGCRVRVEAECHCPDAGAPYYCTCGAPMVPLPADAP
jgi:metallothionein